MTALTLPAPDVAPPVVGDVLHTVCCDPDRAICGTDVSAEPWVDGGQPATCDVCAAAEWLDCPDNGCRGRR